MHVTQAAQWKSCRWSVPVCLLGGGRVYMLQQVAVERYLAFAGLWIKCESSAVDIV